MAKTHWKLATAAIVAIAIGSGIPAMADTTNQAQDCLAEDNVWVHVEYDDTVTGGCATTFSNAQEATVSAGLTDEEGPFFTTISGRTADGVNAREWWSLWTATGPAGDWVMAEVGANELTLEAGGIVSWTLQPDWNIQPGPAPQSDPVGLPSSGV